MFEFLYMEFLISATVNGDTTNKKSTCELFKWPQSLQTIHSKEAITVWRAHK